MKVLDKGTSVPGPEVEVGSGALWLPYKSILETVNRAVSDTSAEAFADLDVYVKKTNFASIFNTPRRSQVDREMIRKAVTEGVQFKGQESRQTLPQQLVNETLLLSDIFDLNEFYALDLLATAETLQDEYPGWARGLIAVFLYFEGRLCVIQALTTMITAVPGRTWEVEGCLPRIQATFEQVINNTFSTTIMDTLLKEYEHLDVKKQMEDLDNNLALGDWRHRFEINRMISGIREGLAFIVFGQCAQKKVEFKEVLRILEHLRNHVKIDENTNLDKAQCLLIHSVVFSLWNQMNTPEYNTSFAKEFLKYLKEVSPSIGDSSFLCPELVDIFRLVFNILSYKAISEQNVNSLHMGIGNTANIVRDDDDSFLRRDVFAFLRDHLFYDSALITFEANVFRRYHELLKDFIVYMPMKVKEMKGRSDDAAKTAALYHNQGFVRPPNLPQEYESFMECLGVFYSCDELNLSVDYFDQGMKHLALNKLARGACIDTPTMFIPNARFMTGLARGAPEEVFDVLKQNGHNFSFDHFFESIMAYLSSFGSNGSQFGFNGTNLFKTDAYQRVVHDSVRIQMNPAEVQGICVYLELVERVCENSPKVASFFTNQKISWIKILLDTSKIRTIPREIRAKMIGTAAAMISDRCGGDTVTSLWDMFYQVRLIGQDNVDFKEELDEHEARTEMYPLTISMLKLIEALINARFKQVDDNVICESDGLGNLDNGAFDSYVSYVRDSVFQRAVFRTYKNVHERWEVCTLSMNILSKLLDQVPQIMLQLLCGSPLLRSVLVTLVECVQVREMSVTTLDPVDKCSYACLSIIRRALHRQSYFLHRRELSTIRQEAVIVGMQELLMRVVPDSGRPEYIVSILKFIDSLQPPLHKQAALDILWLTLADRDDIDSHLYAAIIQDHHLVSLLRHTFINTLYETSMNNMRKSVLQIIRVSAVHSSPNFGMLLLGVDKKVDFQNAGVAGYPRTVLHAILDNAPNLPDAFSTLLVLIRDRRLWTPLLRYLKTNHFFSNFIRESFPSPSMELHDIGYLLKCVAVELKMSTTPGPLAKIIIGEGSSKFQEVLNMLDLDEDPLEMPELEFFDQENVLQAMKACEYYDPRMKIRMIRVDMLESMLKEEIAKLEKSTILKLRQTVQNETKEVLKLAVSFNTSRWKDAARGTVLDGWRQCLEVLVLSTETLKIAGVDFITSILRVLLNKIVGSVSLKEYICRLAAETVLTLSAVMATFKNQVNSTTLNVILNHVCKWISEEQSPRVRATLYAAVLHVVGMFKNPNEAGSSTVGSFSLILDNLCKDCCQSKEIGRMQAMYVLGEIIRLTAEKGLIGTDGVIVGGYGDTSQNETLFGSDSGLKDLSGIAQNATFRSAASSKSYSSQVRGGSDFRTGYSSIISYMMSKGFLSNLVDGITTMDDADLAKLFSSQPVYANLKSLYVFEAKMSLFCRFASSGRKAVLYLLNSNVIHKLADMRVLQVQYFQEDSSYSIMDTDKSHQGLDSAAIQSSPTRKGVLETMFTQILKLLHAMVDSAPKNVLLVEQIWHFLNTHDFHLSGLIDRSVLEKDEPHVGCNLLLSLLAKTARLFPSASFGDSGHLMHMVKDILKLQAVRPRYSDVRIKMLRHSFLLLHHHSRNTEAIKESRKEGRSSHTQFRPIVSNSLSHDQLGTSPDEELSLGVITRIVIDIAGVMINLQSTRDQPKSQIEALGSLMEIGLSIVHEHLEVFIFDSTYKQHGHRFCQDFIPVLENRLVKFVGDAAKAMEKSDFIDMLLLRIRRMVHVPIKP